MSKTSRTEWAEKINGAWRKSVEAILACARHLRDARASLGIDEFKKLVDHELVVGERTVERLLNIAADERLPTHVSLLPPSWGTLYALARVPDPIFTEAIADGRINAGMTRAEAEALIPRVRTPQTQQVFVKVLPPPNEPPRSVSVRISEPEQAHRPDQTPPVEPEHQRERAVLNALLELETLVGDCDAAALAVLARGDHSTLADVVRVLEFMAQLKRVLGNTGPLH